MKTIGRNKFSRAIVKLPCPNMIEGITKANFGLPNYKVALGQHQNYITALEKCGLALTILEADDNYPDSVFVEDTAILTPNVAIVTNPGAPSRGGEIHSIESALGNIYKNVEKINDPGTVEGGDVMMVGNHFYIGLSDRTNLEGAEQLIKIFKKYGMTGSTVKLENVLHLKTGVNYLENNNLLACGEFVKSQEFQKYNIIEIPEEESYAANSLWINNNVLVPFGFPKTKAKIEEAGYNVIEIDTSEFRKLDGGLSCLSLRF